MYPRFKKGRSIFLHSASFGRLFSIPFDPAFGLCRDSFAQGPIRPVLGLVSAFRPHQPLFAGTNLYWSLFWGVLAVFFFAMYVNEPLWGTPEEETNATRGGTMDLLVLIL